MSPRGVTRPRWGNRLINMMTSSNGNIFRVTGPLCGEFTGPGEIPTQRPVTRGFDVFFDLRLNKRLSKQPWGWWFETPSWSLWHHRNDVNGTTAWPYNHRVHDAVIDIELKVKHISTVWPTVCDTELLPRKHDRNSKHIYDGYFVML